MKIVVLDGHALNPGDLSWERLEQLGECEIHDRTSPDEVLARAGEAEVLLTNKTVLGRDMLMGLPSVRYIGVLATGYNVVDVTAARELGITVTNVPAYGARSVAQMVFALLFELALRVGHHDRTVKEGRWTACKDFCYWDFPLQEIGGLSMGLIGLGKIGELVASIAMAFGMNVIAHDPFRKTPPPENVWMMDMDMLLGMSDVVSLHCPLTSSTRGLINSVRLSMMKPGSYLINTSRGPVVVDQDLANALNSGHLAGAGLDVLSTEPPPIDNPLLSAKNCVITPHIAWASRASRQRLLEVAVASIKMYLRGNPINVVN